MLMNLKYLFCLLSLILQLALAKWGFFHHKYAYQPSSRKFAFVLKASTQPSMTKNYLLLDKFQNPDKGNLTEVLGLISSFYSEVYTSNFIYIVY